MKKRCSIVFTVLLLMFLLASCGNQKDIEYSQHNLPEPDRIEIGYPLKRESFEADSETYRNLYDAFSKTWWMTSSGQADIVDKDALIPVTDLNKLHTDTGKRYTDDEIIIYFFYENEPMKWTDSHGKEIEIYSLGFLLPDWVEEDRYVKSAFAARVDDNLSKSEGYFTYYCDKDVIEAFVGEKGCVKNEKLDQPMEFDMETFQEISTEHTTNYMIETNGWGHLVEHHGYWNRLARQFVIQYTFDEDVKEEEWQDARDYKKAMILYGDEPLYSGEKYHTQMISEDTEVILEIRVGDELVAQDVYTDVRYGIALVKYQYEK